MMAAFSGTTPAETINQRHQNGSRSLWTRGDPVNRPAGRFNSRVVPGARGWSARSVVLWLALSKVLPPLSRPVLFSQFNLLFWAGSPWYRNHFRLWYALIRLADRDSGYS